MNDTSDQTDRDSGDLASEPASISLLEALHLDDLISRDAYERGRTLLWPPERAWYWLDRGLLVVGGLLILAGVIFGFAYNWSAVPTFAKFAFVEIAIAASILGAGLKGWDTNVGRAGVSAAAILVGVFLAVFGQIYQTGADSWELFAGWAALITGYVGLARFQALWLVWLGLWHVAGILYWYQMYFPDPEPTETLAICLGLASLDAIALTLREWASATFEEPWLHPVWPRWLLLASGLGLICSPALGYVAFAIEAPLFASWLSGLAWAFAVGAGYVCFRHILFDRVALAAVGLAGLSIPVSTGIRACSDWLTRIPAVGLLATAVILFAATGVLVLWLQSLPREGETGEAPDA